MAGRPMAVVELAHLSDTGRVRHHNEDRSLAGEAVIAVADGMGGAKAGEVAAQVAVEALAELRPPVRAGDVRAAIARANTAIRDMARDDPEKSGMGTTMTAAMLDGARLDVVHVGDSRAYLWRDGALRQLTEDHSVVAELVKRGSISPEDAERHPHRNVITRALGAEPEVVIDTVSETLRDDDVVLLCSDGLSSYVGEDEIAAALAGGASLEQAAERLVASANAAGGTDNVTVVLARVGPAAGNGSAPESGDTAEAPTLSGVAVAPPDEDPATAPTLSGPAVAGEDGDGDGDGVRPEATRVLGGVRGLASREGEGTAVRTPRVLEPVPRRRRGRLRLAAAAVVVVLALVAGGLLWAASRNYFVEAAPDGTVRVSNGAPFDVAGLDLSSPWQDIGLDAGAVRAGASDAFSDTRNGQGEAVAQAARLVWRFGLTDPPEITAPPPPAPASATPNPAAAPAG